MAELPAHTQRQPAEWSELQSISEHILTERTPARPLARTEMYQTVVQLDDETLEHNRYYSLGLVTCHFMQIFSTDERAKEYVIQRAAGKVAEHSRQNHVERLGSYRGIRLLDLAAPGLHNAADALIGTVNGRLRATDRLLANALMAAGMVRLYDRGAVAADNRPASSVQARLELAADILVAHRHGAALAAQRVAQNLFAGATGIYIRGLHNLSGTSSGKYDDVNPVISDIAGPAELRDLRLFAPALQAARLRIDEFGSPLLDMLLGADERGDLLFRRELLNHQPPAGPAEGTGNVSLHTARLGCPAIRVSGAIAQVLQFMPDIIGNAQQLTAEM